MSNSDSGNNSSAPHRMHISVDRVVEIPPDKVDEYLRANYDLENERVKVSDIDATHGMSAKVIRREGPGIQELVTRD